MLLTSSIETILITRLRPISGVGIALVSSIVNCLEVIEGQ